MPQTPTPKVPTAPRTNAAIMPAELPQHALVDDAVFNELTFGDLVWEGMSADFAEVIGSRFTGTNLSSTHWYRGSIVDAAFDTCDLANAQFIESGWQRVLAERSRLTGLQVAACTLTNVRFVDSVIDLSNWRFAKLKRVVFGGCSLAGSDWGSAELEDVFFDGCDLSGAQFSQAKTTKVRFQQCKFDGLKGVASLSGSVIDPINLMDLTYQMAAALGITIPTD